MRLRFVLSILVLNVGILDAYSQSVLSGEVLDVNDNVLSSATITINKDTTASILAYGISDGSGSFSIQLETESDSVHMKVSHMGHKTWHSKLSNESQHLSIQLEASFDSLKEVHLKSHIIEKRGDTLSYSVTAFKEQKDRVIADVLKKMPGIEIRGSGQIYYQDEPINKYYIEGLDLLEGRYNLANNNLSADAVAKVQILENHQPIKLLDSLVFSERAAINIKLKDDVTVSGTAKAGAGFSPLLWQANITPMVFNKKQQAIVSYQTNNTGSDVSREVQDFSIAGLGGQEFSIAKKDWLSVRQLATPPFSQEQWLDNNVHLGSLNYLIRLKKDVDLKVNVSYLNDAQKQSGSTQTRFFTPNDVIDITERIDNAAFYQNLQTKFTLERNTKNNYLKNTLEINGYWDSQVGNIQTRAEPVSQKLRNPFSAFRNKLNLMKPIGNQLVTFKSNTGYTETTQNLKVQPGQFSNLLNEDESYVETAQDLESSTFFTENSAGITKRIKNFTVSPKIGFAIQSQKLNSRLAIIHQDAQEILEGNYQNKLDHLSTQWYATSRFTYTANNWNIRLQTPFKFRSFEFVESSLDSEQNLGRFFFDPHLFIKKDLTNFWASSISGNLQHSFGDISRMYRGFVLTDYRNLRRYNAPMAESFRQNYTWRLSYRNPLEALFSSASYSYRTTKSNLLYSNSIDDAGTSVFEALPINNNFSSHNFSVRASKYFNKLSSTLSLSTSFSTIARDQLINGSLEEINNQNVHVNAKLESLVVDWLSITYNADWRRFKTLMDDREIEPIVTQAHSIDGFFYLNERQYLSLSSDYYFNSVSGVSRYNYFMNLSYQYTFKKPALDLNISWNNILNADKFMRVSSSEFSYVQSTYALRPSQLLVKLRFSY